MRLPRPSRLYIAAALFLAAPGALRAQQQDPTRPVILGRVVDAETRQPLAGAFVSARIGGGGVITDSLGVFALQFEVAPAYEIAIEQLGYASLTVTLGASAPGEFSTILLRPNPIALKGLEVLVDRFERRRRFYFGSVHTVDQDRLLRSAQSNAYDLVRSQVPLARPCRLDAVDLCFFRRGQERQVQLCIDEVPAFGGAQELQAYHPQELYLVEVYDRGLQVRVYTRWFVENRLDSGRGLQPISWGC